MVGRTCFAFLLRPSSLSFFLFLLPAVASADRPPHLIYVLADDLGHSNVGWNNPDVSTPHLDSLRAGGVALDRHYVYKFCSPTRSSFLSGRLPIHVNQENSATEQRYSGIPLNMTTFTERLEEQGYVSAHVGKVRGMMCMWGPQS